MRFTRVVCDSCERVYLVCDGGERSASEPEELGKKSRDMVSQKDTKGMSEMRSLTSMVTLARNSKINASGFSPSQRVLKRGLKLPWGILNKENLPVAAMDAVDDSPSS